MLKITISMLVTIILSHNALANCVDAYKSRAVFKTQRAKKDPNPYKQRKAREAVRQSDILDGILSGKNSQFVNSVLYQSCINLFISPGMPDGESNADIYCKPNMLRTYPGFKTFLAKRNAQKEFCKPIELGWFKRKLRGNRSYPPTDYSFYIMREFSTYLFKYYQP